MNQSSVITALLSHIASELTPVDREAAFENMLRDVYGDSVSVCGMDMDPIRVLKEMDETAYRCGVNDYIDSCEMTEVEGETYHDSELEEAKEQFLDAKRDELSEAETGLEVERDIENGEGEAGETVNPETIAELLATITRLTAEIDELENHSF